MFHANVYSRAMQYSQKLRHVIYPWLVIFFCALFLFYKYILQVSPSVMTSELMQSFHIHAAGLGNLAATFFYAYLVVQLFAGPLLDRFSPRILMSFAILMCAIGTIIFSVANMLWVAAIGRMMVGVGAAFATVGYMKMAAIYFPPHRFALVGGLLATAAMIGAMLGETPLALMVHAFGWQNSLFYIGFTGAALALFFLIIVQDKKDTHLLDSPAEGQLRLNKNDFLSVLKRKQNWLLAFYSGMAFAPVAVFGGLWGNPFLQAVYHTDAITTANFISLIFLGLAIGGPVLGYVSDRLQNRLGVMCFGSVISLVSIALVIYCYLPFFALRLALLCFGFGTGAFMLGFATGKDINPPMLAATVVALINTGDAIFGAVTEPFIGKLLDVFWRGGHAFGARIYAVASYREALTILVVYLAAALSLLFWLRQVRQK